MTFEISRLTRHAVFGLASAALTLAACGGKPAEDASTARETTTADSDPGPKEEAAPPPRKASPPPPPDTTPKTVYDKEAVEIDLKRAARQVLANCGAASDDQGKANGPWGKTTITVQLGHNGHSKGATMQAPFDGSPTGKCIFNSFNNLIYPPFAGGDTTVEWEVESVKPAAAPAAKK